MVLVCSYLLAGAWGVRSVYQPDPTRLNLLFQLLLALAITFRCVVAGRIVAKPLPLSCQGLMVLTWPVAVPAYLFWTRRLWGLGLAVAHGVGMFATSTAAYHLAGYVLYGQEWLRRLGLVR